MLTHIKLDAETERRFQALAEKNSVSAEKLAETAIRTFVDRADARQDFMNEADAAWADFQNDGLHATGNELREWLRRWGTDQTEPPKCHG